jgi:hypothetical protein
MGVTVLVEFANFFTYGVLWIGKFTIFNRWLFNTPSASPAPGGLAVDELASVDLGAGSDGLTTEELSAV